MTNLVPFDPQAIVTQAIDMLQIVLDIREKVLKEDIDFGSIVDGGKPTLLKPGAEKLANAFKLCPDYRIESIVENWDTGLFFYRYKCVLVHRETGEIWGSGVGSCSTQEEKYGYRWMSADRVPSHLDRSTLPMRKGSITEFEFAIKAAETGGQYGKPQEYWDAFKLAIDNRTAVKGERKTKKGMSTTWSIGGDEYRVPNLNVFDTVNTVDKMAQKRALVAAVLVATNASAHFTQDIEDFDTDKGNVLTGRSAPMTKAPAPIEPAKPEAPQWWPILKEVKPKLNAFDFDSVVSDLKRGLNEGRISMSMSDTDVRAMLFEEFAIDIRKKKPLDMSDITEDEFSPPNGS